MKEIIECRRPVVEFVTLSKAVSSESKNIVAAVRELKNGKKHHYILQNRSDFAGSHSTQGSVCGYQWTTIAVRESVSQRCNVHSNIYQAMLYAIKSGMRVFSFDNKAEFARFMIEQ